MTLGDLARTSFGNLGRHPVRTILSAIGVTVGILTIVTMLSVGIGVQQEIIRQFKSAGLETLVVQPVTEELSPYTPFAEPKRTVVITPALVEEMQGRDDVVEVWPRVLVPWGAKIYLELGEDRLSVRVQSGRYKWEMNDPFTKPPEMLAGEEFAHDAQGEVVLGAEAVQALGYETAAELESLLGEEVFLVLQAPRGDTQTFAFRVTGVVESDYFGANIGLEDSLALKAWWYNDPDILEHEGYDTLTIKAASLNDATQILEELQQRGFEVESLRTILDMINRSLTVLEIMLGSVGGLALFVASIGIANTMVMAVYERTKEIGILKAVGASPGDIRGLFMAEAGFIGLVGGVVGTIGGWLLGLGLNQVILALLRWQEIPVEGTFFVVTWWLVGLALGFATLVGLLAGLYPAARAARMDPVEALRYE